MNPQPLQPPAPEVDKTELAEEGTATLAKRPGTVKEILQGKEFLAAVGKMLAGTVLTPERFVRVTLTAIMKTPDLAECSRPSLFRALLDLSGYGLEPDGRRAHLIPFRNKKMCSCGHLLDEHKGQKCSHCECGQRRVMIECQLIVDYKGLVELVRRSGMVSYIHADVVYEQDAWDFGYGSGAFLKHKPGETRGSKRKAFYSFVKMKDGSEDFIVLSPDEVEKIRKRSKSPDNGPWATDYDEMGKKTAFRRHTKWLPLFTQTMREAIERGEDLDAVDVTGTWTDLLGEGDKPNPRDRILSQPSYAPEAPAVEGPGK